MDPYQADMALNISALRELGLQANVKEINERVSQIGGLTEQQLNRFTSQGASRGRSVLQYCGAVERVERGVWRLTDYGRTIHSTEQIQAMREKYHREHLGRKK